MAVTIVEKNSADWREKRAKSIASMGLVNRKQDRFIVSTPSLRGKQTTYQVWREARGQVRCNCLEFEEMTVDTDTFRCEHILAVKFALQQKNTEPGARTKVVKTTESESSRSKLGEQKANDNSVEVSEPGQSGTINAEHNSLTAIGENTMKQQDLPATTFSTVAEANLVETRNNVLAGNFASTLRNLQQNIAPELVKQRDGWKDRGGTIRKIDYVEWHTVADILDEKSPSWTHTVKDIKQFGNIITVTVAIAIDGITREGLGTGLADSETGIKKAEHDALKRAAVKFGIARELYKKETETFESRFTATNGEFPANPLAVSLMDLVTAKQLGLMRAIGRETGVDADGECQTILGCRADELSKKAASALIEHLQNLQTKSAATQPLRKAS